MNEMIHNINQIQMTLVQFTNQIQTSQIQTISNDSDTVYLYSKNQFQITLIYATNWINFKWLRYSAPLL